MTASKPKIENYTSGDGYELKAVSAYDQSCALLLRRPDGSGANIQLAGGAMRHMLREIAENAPHLLHQALEASTIKRTVEAVLDAIAEREV